MSDTWRKIEELYHAALERDAAERTQFLNEATGGDDQLRQKVERLLKAHELADDFLSTPALEVVARVTASTLEQESLGGRQISHYDVQSLLGAGGMGEVYLARDRRLNRSVALKILPQHMAANEDRLQRFLREAKAASNFNHPNIAAIHDIGAAAGLHFIAMEYVQGKTLAARIAAHPLIPAEIAEIAIQVADALSEAHALGIVHRDIKPANLMLTPHGYVKVLDFGLAKSLVSGRAGFTIQITKPGTAVGTLQYMSPEQIFGRDVDHRTDIFSLGVVLYEMAAGSVPFASTSMTETKDLILHSHPKPIPTLPENGGLARIINRCLEKQRNQRYQSARELWLDLKKC
jgi:eukaryotic-like serine/threonine-protein kinase